MKRRHQGQDEKSLTDCAGIARQRRKLVHLSMMPTPPLFNSLLPFPPPISTLQNQGLVSTALRPTALHRTCPSILARGRFTECFLGHPLFIILTPLHVKCRLINCDHEWPAVVFSRYQIIFVNQSQRADVPQSPSVSHEEWNNLITNLLLQSSRRCNFNRRRGPIHDIFLFLCHLHRFGFIYKVRRHPNWRRLITNACELLISDSSVS